MRHDDLQPVLARLLDLLGQPLVGPGVGVQIEKHVRGVARLLGGGDGETGEIGGELGGQLVCALIERRGPEHDGLGEGDRLALDLARDEEREGGQARVVWRAEEERLRVGARGRRSRSRRRQNSCRELSVAAPRR